SLMRAALIMVIELPQMVLGAVLSLSMTDYYPVYTICGRIFDMTALNDQHYGGLIIWLPGTLTSFAAMIVVLAVMRINEEREGGARRGIGDRHGRRAAGGAGRRGRRAGERCVVSRPAGACARGRLLHAAQFRHGRDRAHWRRDARLRHADAAQKP